MSDEVQNMASVLSRLLDQPIDTWSGKVRFKGELVSLIWETPDTRRILNKQLTVIVPEGVSKKRPGNLIAKFPVAKGYTNRNLFFRSVKLSTSHLLQAFKKIESYIDIQAIEENNARNMARTQGIDIPKGKPANS